MTGKRKAELCKAILERRDAGKQAYAEADAALDKLIGSVEPNEVIELGGGVVARVVDNFEHKTKVWKPCGISRFDIKVLG